MKHQMLGIMTRARWTLTLRGVVAVALGLAALLWPRGWAIAALAVVAAFSFINGALMLVAALASPSGERLPATIAGIIGLIVGALVIVWPVGAALVLVYIVAIWAVMTGALELLAAVELRHVVIGEWILATSGLLSVAFGLLLAISPGTALLALAWLFGIYAIFYGVLLIVLAFRLRTFARPTVR